MIGIGMVPDVNGRITQEDEEWAVASAVQNMHLMCTAYGLGAKVDDSFFHEVAGGQIGVRIAGRGKSHGLVFCGISRP